MDLEREFDVLFLNVITILDTLDQESIVSEIQPQNIDRKFNIDIESCSGSIKSEEQKFNKKKRKNKKKNKKDKLNIEN